MEKIRFWVAPVALAVAWTVVSAFVLVRLAEVSVRPVATVIATEIEIEVSPPPSPIG